MECHPRDVYRTGTSVGPEKRVWSQEASKRNDEESGVFRELYILRHTEGTFGA